MKQFNLSNVKGHLTESITKRLRSRVEAVYCAKHGRFARFIIENPQQPSWRIEACCEDLAKRAKAAAASALK